MVATSSSSTMPRTRSRPVKRWRTAPGRCAAAEPFLSTQTNRTTTQRKTLETTSRNPPARRTLPGRARRTLLHLSKPECSICGTAGALRPALCWIRKTTNLVGYKTGGWASNCGRSSAIAFQGALPKHRGWCRPGRAARSASNEPIGMILKPRASSKRGIDGDANTAEPMGEVLGFGQLCTWSSRSSSPRQESKLRREGPTGSWHARCRAFSWQRLQ